MFIYLINLRCYYLEFWSSLLSRGVPSIRLGLPPSSSIHRSIKVQDFETNSPVYFIAEQENSEYFLCEQFIHSGPSSP